MAHMRGVYTRNAQPKVKGRILDPEDPKEQYSMHDIVNAFKHRDLTAVLCVDDRIANRKQEKFILHQLWVSTGKQGKVQTLAKRSS